MGIQQMMMGVGSTGYTAIGTTVTYSGGSPYITVNTDGTITLNGSSPSSQNYYLPTTAGIGTGKYMMVTQVSGDTVSGDDYFLNPSPQKYSLPRDFGLKADGGTGRTAVYTVAIYDSDTVTLLVSGNFTFVN